MDFSSSNTLLWNLILQFCFLSVVVVVANLLRRKVPFIRKSLMPTAVLAGFIMLLIRVTGIAPVDSGFMDMLTYHSIAIGFIALSLQVPKHALSAQGSDFTGAKSGALIVSCYLLQGFVGLVISIGLAYTVMPELFPAAGLLLPMGYGQGPGQANNVGSTFENLGFSGGQSFGLSIAAVGFLVACVVGVIYLNILKRQGKILRHNGEIVSGSVTVDDFESKNELPVSESIDRFSVQSALILVIYLLTYLLMDGLVSLLGSIAPGLAATVSPILWGFNFVIGSLLALLCRLGLKFLMKRGVVTHQYQNNYLLSRISGAAFDFMVVAGIAAIDIRDLSGLVLPFTLMCAVGGAATLLYLKWICKTLYPGYYYEGYLSMFGMMTGTISSGVLLLREIDQDFSTPASNNLLIGTSFAIAFGAPMLVFIGLAPQSETLLFITLGLIAVYFALLLLFMLKARKKAPPKP